MPHLVSIVYKPSDVESKPADRYARVSVERAVLTPRQGIVGDEKGGTGGRQLNIMRAETLAELEAEGLHTAPGALGEQLVIAGLSAEAFASGVQLRVGDFAVIELGILRTGCALFEHIQRRAKASVAGRLGWMGRVLAGGEIEVGDSVSVATTHDRQVTQQELFT